MHQADSVNGRPPGPQPGSRGSTPLSATRRLARRPPPVHPAAHAVVAQRQCVASPRRRRGFDSRRPLQPADVCGEHALVAQRQRHGVEVADGARSNRAEGTQQQHGSNGTNGKHSIGATRRCAAVSCKHRGWGSIPRLSTRPGWPNWQRRRVQDAQGGGSNPSPGTQHQSTPHPRGSADRAPDYESGDRRFESCRGYTGLRSSAERARRSERRGRWFDPSRGHSSAIHYGAAAHPVLSRKVDNTGPVKLP